MPNLREERERGLEVAAGFDLKETTYREITDENCEQGASSGHSALSCRI
jgi:hypothetical protein